MNKNELRARMARHGDTGQTLASALGISLAALSDKINGHTCFKQNEMKVIIDRYSLTAEDTQAIFFDPSVS